MVRKISWAAGIIVGLALLAPAVPAQAPAAPGNAPRIDVLNCDVEAKLLPDVHELEAVAAITFEPLEPADYAVFDLNDNLFVTKVVDGDGVEMEFDRNRAAPETLTVHFPRRLEPGTTATIRIEYDGGFDNDRYSRIFSRDLGSAYIGMEGTVLMYAAKWIPLNRFLADRATGTLSVTVPLGMTVIGPGRRLPVVTRGDMETFAWKSETPILPGSMVAGHYFPRSVRAGEFEIECFARKNNLEAIEGMAHEAGKILGWYAEAFGPAGTAFRLVEVDEAQARQHGMYGTFFVTRRELSQGPGALRQLARRIAGQWWQEAVGVRGSEDLWLADGMAYLSAARYLGSAGGDAAFKEEIDQLAVLALKFEKQAAVRSGLDLGYRSDRYESVVAGKGAWVLHMLQGILGEEKFDRLVRDYYRTGSGAEGGGAGEVPVPGRGDSRRRPRVVFLAMDRFRRCSFPRGRLCRAPDRRRLPDFGIAPAGARPVPDAGGGRRRHRGPGDGKNRGTVRDLDPLRHRRLRPARPAGAGSGRQAAAGFQ